MTFQKLNALYFDLRDGIRAQVHPAAIADLNVRPPAGDSDEASFLRLTAWCYTLLYEAARVSIPFLIGLPSFSSEAEASTQMSTLRAVHALRTALSHNLGFDDGHDLALRRDSSHWFIDSCGAIIPANETQWKKCCMRLCDDAASLLTHCSSVLSKVATSVERGAIFDVLRDRIDRDWPAYKFDEVVADAAARVGEKINAKAFREQRLTQWRKFVGALPDDADVRGEVERLVESSVLEHFRARLPVSGGDLIKALGLEPGPAVRAALESARRGFDQGVTSSRELIDFVRHDLATVPNATEVRNPNISSPRP